MTETETAQAFGGNLSQLTISHDIQALRERFAQVCPQLSQI
jgi:hypothetical protein